MYSSAGLLKLIVADAKSRAALCRYMATAPGVDQTEINNLNAEADNLESLAAAAERRDSSAVKFLCKKMKIERAFSEYEKLVELEAEAEEEAEADNTPSPF